METYLEVLESQAPIRVPTNASKNKKMGNNAASIKSLTFNMEQLVKTFG